MNHRDERADWPTSTTAVVLWQRGQGGGSGLTGVPVLGYRNTQCVAPAKAQARFSASVRLCSDPEAPGFRRRQ